MIEAREASEAAEARVLNAGGAEPSAPSETDPWAPPPEYTDVPRGTTPPPPAYHDLPEAPPPAYESLQFQDKQS